LQGSDARNNQRISHETKENIMPYEIGRNIFIRTVTMALTGKLAAVGDKELVLTNAAWIADTGRYAQAVATGVFSEVEPYPATAKVIVGRGAVVDAVHVDWALPAAQK
jgi:hypothetical protein